MLPFCPLGQNSLAADFSDSNLTGAHLTNADLRGSNLSGADLTGADLSGTDLTGASVTQRQLDGACGSDTKLPAGLTITSCAASTVQAPPPEAHNEDGTSTGDRNSDHGDRSAVFPTTSGPPQCLTKRGD
jgi:Pentapeptide repeats (8 copies)